MVYFLSRGNPTLLLTTLTERVSRYISVTDTLPCPVVPLPHSGVAVVAFVTPSFLLGMFITEPTIRQLGAAGMRTRTLGFKRQWNHLVLGMQKALAVFREGF